MKVSIGEKYSGPAWDRPSLRRLPLGWELSVEEDAPTQVEQWLWAAAWICGGWIVAVIGFSLV